MSNRQEKQILDYMKNRGSMDAKEYLETVAKTCNSTSECKKCPFFNAGCLSVYNFFPGGLVEKKIDEAIAIAERLNHRKTYAEDFLEKFPNAILETICRDLVYGLKRNCGYSNNCADCWSEPMPEEPGGDE